MELQRLNKYPLLHPQAQTPQHSVSVDIQTQSQFPSNLNPDNTGYVFLHENYAPRNTTYYPVEPQMPYLQGSATLPFTSHGPILPAHHHGNYLKQPFLPLTNYSHDGYYLDISKPYYQPPAYPTSSHSTEYFTDTSTSTQPSENQATISRRQELENEIQKYKCVAYIHWMMVFLAAIYVPFLGLLLLTQPCNGSDEGYCKLRDKLLGYEIVMLFFLPITVHIYALSIYVSRNARAMNYLFWICLVLLGISIITLNAISIWVFGFLTFTSNRLRELFFLRELEEAKISASSQTVHQITCRRKL